MKLIPTAIQGLVAIQPDVFHDSRGYFQETYSMSKFNELGIDTAFVQDNESMSQRGVLRGLHFQNPPHAQAKLVRVIRGSVLDVAVDIRRSSPTYGQHHSIVLSGENKIQFFVPAGFAHGFLVLEDNTIFSYKCSGFYNKASEDALLWSDPDLKIDWKIQNPVLSEKDKAAGRFCDFKSPF